MSTCMKTWFLIKVAQQNHAERIIFSINSVGSIGQTYRTKLILIFFHTIYKNQLHKTRLLPHTILLKYVLCLETWAFEDPCVCVCMWVCQEVWVYTWVWQYVYRCVWMDWRRWEKVAGSTWPGLCCPGWTDHLTWELQQWGQAQPQVCPGIDHQSDLLLLSDSLTRPSFFLSHESSFPSKCAIFICFDGQLNSELELTSNRKCFISLK